MNLRPRDFWSLSLVEWRWLLAAFAPADRLSLDDLKALAAAYPDAFLPPSPARGRGAGGEGEPQQRKPDIALTPNPSPVNGRGERGLP